MEKRRGDVEKNLALVEFPPRSDQCMVTKRAALDLYIAFFFVLFFVQTSLFIIYKILWARHRTTRRKERWGRQSGERDSCRMVLVEGKDFSPYSSLDIAITPCCDAYIDRFEGFPISDLRYSRAVLA
jgi:hypothetical protein